LPSIFGLHLNADITFRIKESIEFLGTVMETQPKEGGGGAGASREDIVQDLAKQLLGNMPQDFFMNEIKKKIEDIKGPKTAAGISKGMNVPTNIFFFQEIQRLQNIINIVRKNLSSLIDAIDGLVTMTPQLSDSLNSIFDAQPVKFWLTDPSGAEISWNAPNLSVWFSGPGSLVERAECYNQ